MLCDGAVIGRIFKANAAPVGMPWMWTLAFGQHEDRTPTHGYAATREAAMSASAKTLAATESRPGQADSDQPSPFKPDPCGGAFWARAPGFWPHGCGPTSATASPR